MNSDLAMEIIDNLMDGIQVIGFNMEFLYVNKSIATHTGVEKGELLGKSMKSVCPGIEKTKLYKTLLECMKTRSGARIRNELKCPSGNTGWFDIIIEPIPEGLLILLHDITKNRTRDEQLKNSLRQLNMIFEYAPDGYYLMDLKGIFRKGNKAAENFTGYKREELIGKYFLAANLLSPDQFPLALKLLGKNIMGKPTGPDELTLTRKDGSKIITEIVTNPIKIKNETLVLAVARDVTERKLAEERLRQSLEKNERIFRSTIEAVSDTIEIRDSYTAGHQKKATKLACAIAERMRLSEDRIEGIRMAGMIHDLGKLAVPAEILSKPSELSDVEFHLIKIHPSVAFDILTKIEFPWPVAEIVYQHHERIDGSGYPRGLKGEDILLESKILAVADAVEAMSSHRPYRPALGIRKALETISRMKGSAYDIDVVDACITIFKKGFKFGLL